MKISQKARRAIFLGTLCSVSYLAVYIARNIIGAVTPKMIEDGISFDYIGRVSAVYLVAYAIGQLINGTIGDWIKTKYMVAFGLMSAVFVCKKETSLIKKLPHFLSAVFV